MCGVQYLPSLWYHKVEQRGLTVAVNFWHDMDFDGRFVLQKCLASLAAPVQQLEDLLHCTADFEPDDE